MIYNNIEIKYSNINSKSLKTSNSPVYLLFVRLAGKLVTVFSHPELQVFNFDRLWQF